MNEPRLKNGRVHFTAQDDNGERYEVSVPVSFVRKLATSGNSPIAAGTVGPAQQPMPPHEPEETTI